jgi:hypothetical protein
MGKLQVKLKNTQGLISYPSLRAFKGAYVRAEHKALLLIESGPPNGDYLSQVSIYGGGDISRKLYLQFCPTYKEGRRGAMTVLMWSNLEAQNLAAYLFERGKI